MFDEVLKESCIMILKKFDCKFCFSDGGSLLAGIGGKTKTSYG